MFTDLKSYASTRDTALAWAKVVPSHWKIQRAKTIMYAVDIRSSTGEEELLTVSSGRGVVPRSSANVTMFQAASYVGHKLCWPDDLVINSLWAWGRGLGVATNHGIVSTAYGVYRQRQRALEPAYLHQLVRSQPFQWELQVRSQGVWKSRLQMTDERWLDAPLLIPPATEQAAIVKYLAHANARINNAIAAKRRLISLLEEQQRVRVRTLLMGSAWPLWPLGHLGRIGNGSTPSRSNPAYWDGNTPWLNSSVVNLGVVDSADQFVTAAALTECHLPMVEPGSVLVGITGQGKTRGMSAVLRIRATINQHLAFITPRASRMRAEFLHLALTAGYDELRRISDGNGGTKGALTIADLKAFKVPLPALDEQRQFVMDMSDSAAETVLAVERTTREIELLQEFRTRLVADVVTGQVDVRAVAATLPDAVEGGPGTIDGDSPELDEEQGDAAEDGDV